LSARVTVVIPVYNEGENIRATLFELDAKVMVDAEIWLVYDSDDDTTLAPARELEGKTRIGFSLVKNKYGRGALNAIKTGLEDAPGEFVIVTMADMCDPPEVINDMVAAAERDGADIVCASRYMKGGRQIGGPMFKGFLSRTAGLLLCWFARLPTHDPTNSFKLYRRSFLSKVQVESTGGFELGIELVVKARALGYEIVEVPTTWRDRVAGKSNFKLWTWLPSYLRWFFYAFKRGPKIAVDSAAEI
jgi:glycosyltransferase involved in cell wall biosynthesis